jgi:hypothetical protein
MTERDRKRERGAGSKVSNFQICLGYSVGSTLILHDKVQLIQIFLCAESQFQKKLLLKSDTLWRLLALVGSIVDGDLF